LERPAAQEPARDAWLVLACNRAPEPLAISDESGLADQIARLGGRVCPLADGGIAAVVASDGEARSGARSAAECALALQRHAPGATIAIASLAGDEDNPDHLPERFGVPRPTRN